MQVKGHNANISYSRKECGVPSYWIAGSESQLTLAAVDMQGPNQNQRHQPGNAENRQETDSAW